MCMVVVRPMASILSYLQDPEIVAKFQRACGVIRVNLTHADAAGATPPDVVPNGIVTKRRADSSKQALKNGAGKSHSEKDNSHASNERQTEVVDYKISNFVLHYLFHFSANLGNEIFYMTFLPFWFWNIDGCVGRRLTTFWCIFMYVGQALKDVLQIPRPASPPVIQLEKRYALEYGMPSTHAMVGAGIPFSIYFLTRERYIVSVHDVCCISFMNF